MPLVAKLYSKKETKEENHNSGTRIFFLQSLQFLLNNEISELAVAI